MIFFDKFANDQSGGKLLVIGTCHYDMFFFLQLKICGFWDVSLFSFLFFQDFFVFALLWSFTFLQKLRPTIIDNFIQMQRSSQITSIFPKFYHTKNFDANTYWNFVFICRFILISHISENETQMTLVYRHHGILKFLFSFHFFDG